MSASALVAQREGGFACPAHQLRTPEHKTPAALEGARREAACRFPLQASEEVSGGTQESATPS